MDKEGHSISQGFYLKEYLVNELEAMAQEEDRSMSNMLSIIIKNEIVRRSNEKRQASS